MKRPSEKPETRVIDYSGQNLIPGSTNSRWWDRTIMDDDEAIGRSMVASAKVIESSTSEQERYDLNLLYGSLYEGRELTNLYHYGGRASWAAGAASPMAGFGTSQVTWNVIRSVVQTVASQVSRSRPRARFVTSGGTAKQKRRAKKLTTFCDGIFQECKVYEKTQQAFINAGVFDVAGIHVYTKGARIAVDLVRCNEIMIGANDGIDGKPRAMYRRKFIDKGVLVDSLAKGKGHEAKAAAIYAANAADPTQDGSTTNLVEVYEAWHLPSGEDTEDGWHVIAIESTNGGEGGTLLIEPYKKSYFPIILFSIDPALSGPYGTSAAATLMPIQIEVNFALDKIRKGQHLACRPGVWLPLSAKLNKNQISSAIGQINYYAGNQAPTFYTPAAFSPEVYQQLERHFEKAFSLYGVNTQVASGTKEAGTTSAVAIRESLDIQTARFAVLAQRWETLHIEVAKHCINLAREIYEDSREMRVKAPGTALLESIDWKDVDLDEDEYVIQVYPTSLLPTTPQGRIDRVNELVSSGIWSPKRAEAALDDLDNESSMTGERAAEKLVETMCEKMLIDGEYDAPDATNDLDACLRIGSEYLNDARQPDSGTPEKNIDLLYRFLDDTAELMAAIKGPGPAPADATGGAPPDATAGAAPAGPTVGGPPMPPMVPPQPGGPPPAAAPAPPPPV